jgi:hypothetical protein
MASIRASYVLSACVENLSGVRVGWQVWCHTDDLRKIRFLVWQVTWDQNGASHLDD